MHERLAERVVAADKEFVSGVKPPEIVDGGDLGGFAVFAAVAVFAGKDQIPDAVQIHVREVALQRVREEVVDIAVGTRGGLFSVELRCFRDPEDSGA